MRVLLTGASGFVGRHLALALDAAGHDVTAMTRRPDVYRGAGTPVRGDVTKPETLRAALAGQQGAYYLVHSIDHRDFALRDARAARAFARAAADAGVQHIVYLGGLGDPADELSEHLRSRQEVEGLLAGSGVRVTTLRAGVVIGDRGASWEIVRNLERFPAFVLPDWAVTRTQPISVADVVRYLVGALALPGAGSRVYEVGGAEVLEYPDMLSRLAAVEGRPSLQLTVRLPSVRLAALAASRVLPLLTGVDGHTVRALVKSLRNEVIVRDDAIRALIPFRPMDYDQAVLAALAQRRTRLESCPSHDAS